MLACCYRPRAGPVAVGLCGRRRNMYDDNGSPRQAARSQGVDVIRSNCATSYCGARQSCWAREMMAHATTGDNRPKKHSNTASEPRHSSYVARKHTALAGPMGSPLCMTLAKKKGGRAPVWRKEMEHKNDSQKILLRDVAHSKPLTHPVHRPSDPPHPQVRTKPPPLKTTWPPGPSQTPAQTMSGRSAAPRWHPQSPPWTARRPNPNRHRPPHTASSTGSGACA